MRKIKVLYIDDEKNSLTEPIKQKLESTNKLEVELLKPLNFEQELERLSEVLSKYNCVLLDLQLNGPQEENENGEKFHVRYQAPPLAQMIRTLATEGKIPDLPLILCSTEGKVKESFNKDFTSHDLFDWTFLKDDLEDITIDKIYSIVLGYQHISAAKGDLTKTLCRDYSEIDERILSRFITEDGIPIHEIARVVFKDIVQPVGILINEETLAARLGVDIQESKENWSGLLEKYFAGAKYQGAFNQSWNRWWNDRILDVFEEITRENPISIDAEGRVELLIKHTDFKGLVAAKPIELCKSSVFWNICEITKKALDPFEGYKINDKREPKPWQDYSYVSLLAMVNYTDIVAKAGIKIHPSDLDRFLLDRKKLG